MNDNFLDDRKGEEAEFFDKSTHRRTSFGQIPMEADIRRATRFIPSCPDQEAIDPQMTQIIEGDFRDRFIKYVAHKPNGKVLDIGCGPGWLALEMGRHGQNVFAYDLSSKAIALAKRMLKENPYKNGFGNVNYYLEDVTKVDFGKETLDAVSGWSAFHHLPDLIKFMERVRMALKQDGIVATLDDLPRRPFEKWIVRFFKLVLPTYDRTYKQKMYYLLNLLIGKSKFADEVFSPMEEVAAKDKAVFCFADYLYDKFDVLYDVQFDAFSTNPLMALVGPSWFRYAVAHIIVSLDRLLCRLGVCHGFIRIIIAKKRNT